MTYILAIGLTLLSISSIIIIAVKRSKKIEENNLKIKQLQDVNNAVTNVVTGLIPKATTEMTQEQKMALTPEQKIAMQKAANLVNSAVRGKTNMSKVVS